MRPEVKIELGSLSPTPIRDRWLIRWRIENSSEHPLRILSGRLPHGRFKSEEKTLEAAPTLSPNETSTVDFLVSCGGQPGSAIENAFLILRVLWMDKPWWIFARLRVEIDAQGEPRPVTEMVTAEEVGFSRKTE